MNLVRSHYSSCSSPKHQREFSVSLVLKNSNPDLIQFLKTKLTQDFLIIDSVYYLCVLFVDSQCILSHKVGVGD